MASFNAHSGSSTDRSSAWSGWSWDSRGYWISSRYGPTGELEYGYKYPETTAQNSRQEQATPRTPVEDYIGQAPSLRSESFEPSGGSTYSSQGQNFYTTNSATTSTLPSRAIYQASTSSYTSKSYDNPSATSVNNQGWNVNATYNPAGSSGQNYNADDVAQRMQNLTVNTSASIPQQIYSQTSTNQASVGKQIRRASSSTCEELDERYRVIEEKNQKKFWKIGRVFMMLWTEPAGTIKVPREGGTRNGSHYSTTYLNGTAYTEIRRFVVIGEGYGNSICSPIHTYSGQATLKSNLPDPKQHAIIYTGKCPPDEKWYYDEDGAVVRENLTKDPIRVVREQQAEEGDLGNLSRINYAKIYTVENYVRVLNIGKVHPDSMPSLESNCMFVRPRDQPPQPPRSQSSRSDSKKGDSSKKKSGKKSGKKKYED